ncbi:MAG: glycoside hydrolase family 25 protein [Crocinitomicaceae bacterium]|nr:glycoside hydrolase family 25 protein [Crocinitomicaceae bacterium]
MKFLRNVLIVISLGLVISLGVLVYLSPSKSHYQYLNFSSNVAVGENYLGIDVSHYQGEINWEEVDSVNHYGDSVSFVFIKATEGIDLIDPMLAINAEGVQETDLKFGFYHFYRPDVSAKEQAYHFIDNTQELNATLKPVIDVETIGDLSSNELVDSINTFIIAVQEELRTPIILYTYHNFYEENLKSDLDYEQLIWIANYNNEFEFDRADYAQIWQFTDRGTVDGIGHNVDLNIAKKGNWEEIQRD